MWRLYGSEGVAVRSTFSRLCSSVELEPRDVYVGAVKYFDYEVEQPPTYGNTLSAPFCKRIEYAHERELRLAAMELPASWKGGLFPSDEELRDVHPVGIRAKCDLKELIERVYVSPGATENFRIEVQDLLSEGGIEVPLVVSTLSRRPSLI